MKLFKYFAFSKAKRKKSEEPKDKLTLFKHGFSEFFGTIYLSLALVGLSTVVAGTNKPLEFFLLHPIIIGFYAGFIVVGTCLLIFLRWSCDLNPAVTITRMIKGTNTVRYGMFKIGIQMVAGIVTGLIAYGFGKLGDGQASNHAITASGAAAKTFGVEKLGWAKTEVIGGTWIFFIELVMTSILLFPIFTSMIKDKYRDFAIMFIISMSVWMGLLGGSATLNPARGLAQQVPGLFFGNAVGNAKSMSDLTAGTLALELGTFLAPFFYIFMQGLLTEYVNPLMTKIIEFKNYRTTNMKIDSQKDQLHPKKAKK